MSAQTPLSTDSFHCRKTLNVDGKSYVYYSLPDAEANGLTGISQLPYSMKVLLENLLRHEDGRSVTKADIAAMASWLDNKGKTEKEIGFRPARVLMQDFTGVPAVVDLAAMRDGMTKLGGDPTKINPLVPVDLVIDHSVIVDEFGTPKALADNVAHEYARNGERYNFLKWGQGAFENFRVVPPGTGICHQVNLEYLSQTVWTSTTADGAELAYPDTLVGTDSHTTMVNGLAVLGWGVGGIEAEAAMLGQPLSMLIPEVIGFRLTGRLNEGVTATDLVLTVTQMLRKKGVVNKFVEFYGPGLDSMTLADRATIANMAPEYGATCGFFPVDKETINYLTMSGRDSHRIALVEAYCKAQGLYRDAGSADPVFTDTLSLELGDVVPSMAGPKRPEGRIALTDIKSGFETALTGEYKKLGEHAIRVPVEGKPFDLGHGDVVIAAITSCTNTSNPSVLIAAGLLARNAANRGLTSQTLGQNFAGAGIAGRCGLPHAVGVAVLSRQARIQSGRFWLHDLHRELGSARSGNFEGDPRQRPHRGGRAFGQSQFRGSRQPRRAGELSGVAAARRRLRAGGFRAERFDARASWHRFGRQARLPQRYLANVAGNSEIHHRKHHARNVQVALCRRFQR